MTNTVLGIVGGSGLYDLPGIENPRWETVTSPWGQPSDQILFAEIDGLPIRFLPRHGRGHRISPTDINYRANIDVMKRAGVTDLVSISACGSFREELAPGVFVLVDQFIDRTFAREKSFFGTGLVAHVSVADPVSPLVVDELEKALTAEGIAYQRGGTYLAMEGPQFSSRAESELYRSWGCAVIGMTNMPEAKLAREAELPYATLAMVTDYDCWREGDAVDVPEVLEQMHKNGELARKMVVKLISTLPKKRKASPIDTVLDTAVITAEEERDPEVMAKLDAVAKRFLAKK